MRFKPTEGVVQFFDGVGQEHRVNVDGHFVTEHPTTIAEMIKAGFAEVVEEARAGVEEIQRRVALLLYAKQGNRAGTTPMPVQTGDKVQDDAGVDHQVVSVSADGKTAVIEPIVHDNHPNEVDTTKVDPNSAETVKTVVVEPMSASLVAEGGEPIQAAKTDLPAGDGVTDVVSASLAQEGEASHAMDKGETQTLDAGSVGKVEDVLDTEQK